MQETSPKLVLSSRAIIDAIPCAVIAVDNNKRIVGINSFARKMYGNPDIIGKRCSEVFPYCSLRNRGCPIENLDFETPLDAYKSAQKIQFNDRVEEIKVNIVTAQMDSGNDGHIFLHLLQDDESLARDKLIELEKNLTITTFTAGIAHEFNNMNASIYGLVELVMRQNNLSKQTANDMTTILKIVKRASNLIDQLLIYAKKKPSNKALNSIETIVDNCVKIIRPEFISSGFHIQLIKTGQISEMFLDGNMISLAIMNIILNARDSMVDSPEKRVIVKVWRDEKWACVSIKDFGSGMNPDVVKRIFEPFYTTKGSMGHSLMPGTGLGLSVSEGVIKEHNGLIDVESKPGEGSVFTIKLPIDLQEIFQREISKIATDYNLEGARVLVVDDELELNELLVRALETRGALVQSAYSGGEAIDKLESEDYDLLLLDVQMPDLTGWDIVNKIKYRKNKPRVIIISGNFLVINADESRYVEKVLLKPFDLDEFFQTITEVLELKANK